MRPRCTATLPPMDSPGCRCRHRPIQAAPVPPCRWQRASRVPARTDPAHVKSLTEGDGQATLFCPRREGRWRSLRSTPPATPLDLARLADCGRGAARRGFSLPTTSSSDVLRRRMTIVGRDCARAGGRGCPFLCPDAGGCVCRRDRGGTGALCLPAVSSAFRPSTFSPAARRDGAMPGWFRERSRQGRRRTMLRDALECVHVESRWRATVPMWTRAVSRSKRDSNGPSISPEVASRPEVVERTVSGGRSTTNCALKFSAMRRPARAWRMVRRSRR